MTTWVFAYGSLLWNPGFTPAETIKARLKGFSRSFCMLSVTHRGTRDAPGLVLALDAEDGASCTGVALRMAQADETLVLAMLRERELITAAYNERQVPLRLEDGREVTALAYVIDPGHPQYCRMPLERQAEIIATATGGRGPNTDYLFNTAAHLVEMGVVDADMDWLVTRVRDLGPKPLRSSHPD